ncbi:aspartate/glutamate racemase family protein [Pseudaminobacter arsenicus]|uniref:Aspartate/glutamate racemase family protein n=1 Tax=Borborobacter arsenicus TaxID=1851146 RepID=A0A432V0B4_9HYPH|nr:aspartate/glutamate racemase family protein [Pseudaminobacter arsenicus]RUM95525.1 aspartate/glutamate racemase family protein [Pseudaminobacter arsenicus]
MRIILINPNTSVETTKRMVEIARTTAGDAAHIKGLTASSGANLITDVAALSKAAEAVAEMIDQLTANEPDGVLISAFGDPGLEAVRAVCSCPVAGIAEASMIEAARGGRRFGVATTTPALVDSIRKRVASYGFSPQFTGTRTTAGDPVNLMGRADDLVSELAQAVRETVELDGAEAVIIGGGPLGDAAGELSRMLDVPVIEPIPAGVRLLLGLGRRAHQSDGAGALT